MSYGVAADQASPTLSYTEEDALLVLDSSPGMNIKDLATFLNVERSWMSRLVAGMAKARYVKSLPSKNDRRSKELKITQYGRRALEESGELSNKIIEKSLESITLKEQESFRGYLKAYADNLGSPSSIAQVNRHPVYFELWRVSNVVGIFSDSFMDSGLSLTQVQVLNALKELENNKVFASNLAQILPFDVSTISRTISDFEKSKYIKRTPLKEDKRSLIIEMTKVGNDKYSSISRRASIVVKQGMRGISSRKILSLFQFLKN